MPKTITKVDFAYFVVNPVIQTDSKYLTRGKSFLSTSVCASSDEWVDGYEFKGGQRSGSIYSGDKEACSFRNIHVTYPVALLNLIPL